MKKTNQIILNAVLVVCAAFSATGCLNEYLDRAPDAGLTETEVFSKYANFKSYFYSVYNGSNFNIRCHYPLHWCMNSQKLTLEELTDMCDKTRIQRAQPIKLGTGSEATHWIGYAEADANYPNNARVPNTWKSIRVCNMALEKVHLIQDCTEAERNDLIAQAYFVRAFCHFELFRLYGTLPYIDKVLGADDEWDVVPEDDYVFLRKCADDYQTAYEYFDKAGTVRRDPPSGAGNLADANQDKPNGVAALAMKGRVLLYAASPLNNPSGDLQRWEDAAEASAVALNVALAHGYKLLPKADYSKNFYGNKYTNEQLWAYSTGSTTNYNAATIQSFVGYSFSNNSYAAGQCPTQNFVDKFETADGWPLNTEDQRAAATAAGKYNEQNPYVNRDPRFENAVIYNGCTHQGYTPASLYVNPDGSKPSGSLLTYPQSASDGITETFYYERKRTGPLSNKGNQNVMLTDPIIRLAEVYLNYAEAANEAWGPAGKAPSAALTAVEAVNVVRERVEMPAVKDEYCAGKDVFRDRIKNERAVELCFEGNHYFCDIRRWMDAPAIGRSVLYGMRATKVDVSSQYPTGFRYERFALPANRQIAWKNDGMYWFRFQDSDLLKMSNYTPKMDW
jgi:hypothetical protein